MHITSLLIFAGALFVGSATPGPSVAALVARVMARGSGGALAFMLGFAVGDAIWLTAAVLGLSFVAATFALVFLFIKYLGSAYLVYLAWRMWSAPAAAGPANEPRAERPARLFCTALTIALGNPKIMLFYLALIPSIIDLSAVTPGFYAELVVVTFGVLTVVDGSYILLASRLRRLFASSRALKLVNRGSGAMMAGAAVVIATR